MKKTYRMPQATSVQFDVEGMLAASAPTSLGKFEDEDTGGSDGLSNKKENPFWGESKNDMWDNMK